jgi:peroxiredoxin
VKSVSQPIPADASSLFIPGRGVLVIPTRRIWTYLRRLTLIIEEGRIERVFYPVFEPERHASEVLRWIPKARNKSKTRLEAPR